MTDLQSITECVETYFDGLYRGDLGKLRVAFHPAARLVGVVRGVRSERALAEYLGVVAARRSPESLGEERAMRIAGIERFGDVASVHARVAMLGSDFADVLALVREDGRWSIVHKTFTDAGAEVAPEGGRRCRTC